MEFTIGKRKIGPGQPVFVIAEISGNHNQSIDRAKKIIDAEEFFPLDSKKLSLLREIFEDHGDGFLITLAGHRENLDRFKTLKHEGLIFGGQVDYVDLAYRLGKMIPALRLVSQKKGKFPTLKTLIERAIKDPLSPPEKKAVLFAQHQAAEKLRPIVNTLGSAITQDLLEREKSIVRREIVTGIRERRPILKLASMLREKTLAQGNPTNRDYERVARTEMVRAYCEGAVVQIKKDLPPKKDPTVFKQVASTACVHCRRIWGEAPNFRYYKLSEVEKMPSNVDKKAKDWKAQIGPIHPNCTDGPLQVYVDLNALLS